MKHKEYNPLRILGENGWEWRCYGTDQYTSDCEEYQCFTMWIHGDYATLVRACVSEYLRQIAFPCFSLTQNVV